MRLVLQLFNKEHHSNFVQGLVMKSGISAYEAVICHQNSKKIVLNYCQSIMIISISFLQLVMNN